MRRPLCLLGLVYVAAVWLIIYGWTDKAAVCDALDKEQIVAAGYVDWKEYRLSRNTKTAVISLSDAVILKQSQVAVLEQFLSDSEPIPKRELLKFWKKNKTKLCRDEAVGIEGILCYMKEEELPEMGGLVMIQGSYRAFTHATNPGEFDAAQYYAILGRQGRMMDGRLLMGSAAYSAFQETMYRIREYLSLLLDVCYEEQDASVMKAMLLGEKGMLDTQLKELYQMNGIIHILAISGLHLSMIGMGCHKFFRFVRMPRMVDITLIIVLMYCYGTMTGMGTSMLRAYVMFVMHLLAEMIGRTYDLWTATTLAALIILLQQPLYLQHSGFLFSFGAVCGIGILLPAAQRNFFGDSRMEKVFLSGVVVSVATLPVYLGFYYEFPPYSVLLNLVVIPCMAFVLLGGLASLGAAACILSLGEFTAYPVHLLLWFYEKCCQVCAQMPGHIWSAGRPALWQILLFFGILFVLVMRNDRLPKLLFWQGMLCALFVLGVRLPGCLQITMVDVGQGDCIYLSEESGIRLLIDGGSSDKKDVAKYQIMPFLKYEGVSHLDAVVITHPDSDHINGVCDLLEETASTGRFAIDALYLPDVGERGRQKAYHELERLAGQAGVPVRYLGFGDRLQCGNIMLTCLHPEKGWDTEEINAYSTVLHLSYGDFTALFTGDLEDAGERRVEEIIRREGALQDITLLKVAHHGSKNSTGTAFLRETAPKIALISSGRDNRYGHPHVELLERLEKQECVIYRTQHSGAVTVRVRKDRVTVEEYLYGDVE